MKKILAFILSLCFIMPEIVFGAELFSASRSYNEGEFKDIDKSDWFYESVKGAYEYELSDGDGNGRYMPYGLVSVAEVITFADKLNMRYNNIKKITVASGDEKWYKPWIEYAEKNSIILEDEFSGRYEKPATRAQVAYILGNALPFSNYENINTDITDVPDMVNTDSYYNEVIMLYRAGVLTGKDTLGNFAPTENITRAEMAAVMYRIANSEARIKADIKKQTGGRAKASAEYDAEQISEIASSAVFLVAVYDKKGDMKGTGSGFFIDKNGTAVTNYHVIDSAASAQIMTVDGNKYDVDTVLGYSKERDIAVLKIKGEDFPYVEVGDSDEIKNGQKIYCIGSPLGLDNTISEGLISNISREIEGSNYIQISAPISPGSSGGAVFNESAQVIGITSASARDGQNINLVIPINAIYDIEWNMDKTLEDIFGGNVKRAAVISYYDENKNVPDYTSVTGAALQNKQEDENYWYYVYGLDVDQFNAYVGYLTESGYSIVKRQIDSMSQRYIYYLTNSNDTVAVEMSVPSDIVYVAVQKQKSSKGASSDTSAAVYEGTNIPTYTYVCGRRCLGTQKTDSGTAYRYSYSGAEMMAYINYLGAYGFKMGRVSRGSNHITTIMENNEETVYISYAFMYGEVWITV